MSRSTIRVLGRRYALRRWHHVAAGALLVGVIVLLVPLIMFVYGGGSL